MDAFGRIMTRHGRWIVVAVVLAFVVGFLVGYPAAVVLYAVANATGAVLYLDGLNPRLARDRKRGRIVEVLAMVLVPVGFVVVFASKQASPTDRRCETDTSGNAGEQAGPSHPGVGLGP